MFEWGPWSIENTPQLASVVMVFVARSPLGVY
jgi:hypothetical protein